MALEMMQAGGIQMVEAEKDSKFVIDGLNDKGCPEIYGEMLLQDIQAIASETFKHVKRDANKVVHSLAHFITDVNVEQVWLEEVPTSVELLVLNDVVAAAFPFDGFQTSDVERPAVEMAVASPIEESMKFSRVRSHLHIAT
ncbi:conserved hypothetical protein [Ricinus communis]|uniref:RNase H type-1 domain-containing protein n=1 Tax=Ricinus communis TaxID=3988 RepID=B9SGA8_RICCO|nr:conserved hypothetical protein [Ricinus communis]